MATKMIFVDGRALEGKYGERAGDIWEALDRLIAADGNRGIQTMLVKLDDSSGLLAGSAIESGAGWVEVKGAIDVALAAAEQPPDYVMLLGGPDLLPHCELDNPTVSDGDAIVPSDLPYACTAPASTSAADFIGSSRVVSRLPDVPGASDPEVLLKALEFAIGWQIRPSSLYRSFLGISAEVWKGSTQLSLTQLFGNATEMQLSPPVGPAWSGGMLGRLSHFANLHGSPRSTQYYGQSGSSFPVAHDAAVVEGRLEEGAVAAVEACYGAELFEPAGQLPMPLAYLRSGAYGFFGSTTIAYGPAEGNDYADVICRLFQAAVLKGASIGRAGLEARQEYTAQSAPLDPVDLKTLAQFLVLGDPSVQPVLKLDREDFEEFDGPGDLKPRREGLRRRGEFLSGLGSWARPVEVRPAEGMVSGLLDLTALSAGVEATISSFALVGAMASHGMLAMAGEGEDEAEEGHQPAPATMHVVMQEVDIEEAPMPQRVVVLAVEEGGRLISVKTAMTR